ncbi:stealth family protein [Cedecea sp.]|jgi:hypothetical protein|uniref:stealth family protein n=1 Tax=Cedecea sp. TaxID=1970739 RepID=UPI0012AD6AB9|nr:capsule biosynthesis protein CapC [Enterobacteriaceae bacterium RIT693]
MNAIAKKTKKLLKSPGVFLRDYFNKKHPIIRNEVGCPENEESILIKHDLILESIIPTNFDIDVVYTWVNSNDAVWRSKLDAYLGIDTVDFGHAAKDQARFSNHDEIFYSIKSVLKNLPWVRYIYVVTDGQDLKFGNISPKVKLVDHKDIIDEKYLPTFNSHVIEAHLHKIPSLSENFIYFNDDVFVGRPLPAAHFFRSNGVASLFLSNKSLKHMKGRGVNTPTLSASLRSISILENKFSVNIDTPLAHTYFPLKKSMFNKVWVLYKNDIESYLNNKFRTDHDLNLATFFVPWFTYLKGAAVQSRDICHYFNIRSSAAPGYYNHLVFCKTNNEMPHSICANDFNSTSITIKNYKKILIDNMKYHFDNEIDELINPDKLV